MMGKQCKTKNSNIRRGKGLLNTAINKLPFELHIPGYRYCGPGTKLAKRLERGDRGINQLDEACKEHDIAYSQSDNLSERHKADKILADKAWGRFKSKDSKLGERLNAFLVTNAMKGKIKVGMGNLTKKKTSAQRTKSKKNKSKTTFANGKSLFNKAISEAKKKLKDENPNDITRGIKIAKATFEDIYNKKKKGVTNIPRVIPVPKIGGVLPLIPIFAGLSALGALGSGVTNIVKVIKDLKNAKAQLAEASRHNRQMEAITLGKGLHLKPYKKGYGLFLKKNF